MDKNYEWTKDDDQGVQISHSALFICFFFSQSKVSAAIIYTAINHANKCTHCAQHTAQLSTCSHNFCVLIDLKGRQKRNKNRLLLYKMQQTNVSKKGSEGKRQLPVYF